MLRQANCCYKKLSWDFELDRSVNAWGLIEGLARSGFRDASQVPTVREMISHDGHSVVVIPTTGRIQIRVHYLTPLEGREPVARGIATVLRNLVEGA